MLQYAPQPAPVVLPPQPVVRTSSFRAVAPTPSYVVQPTPQVLAKPVATKSQYLLLSPSDKQDLKLQKRIWSDAFDSVQNSTAAGKYSLTAPLLEKIQQKIDRIETFLADGYQEGHQRRKIITRRLVGGKDKAVLKATLSALQSLVVENEDFIAAWENLPGMAAKIKAAEKPGAGDVPAAQEEDNEDEPSFARNQNAWQLRADESVAEDSDAEYEELPVTAGKSADKKPKPSKKPKPTSEEKKPKPSKKPKPASEEKKPKPSKESKPKPKPKPSKEGKDETQEELLCEPTNLMGTGVGASETQKPLKQGSKQAIKAKTILQQMKSYQPFHELDRWHALAGAGLVADYWIEEVVDDDVETPVVRTVSYGAMQAGL